MKSSAAARLVVSELPGGQVVSHPVGKDAKTAREKGTQPVVAGDKDGARARLLACEDLVGRLDALLLVGSAELVGELVVADGTDVGDRVGREDVLRGGGRGTGSRESV